MPWEHEETLNWTQIKDIIERNDLHLLGRSAKQQVVYDAFFDEIVAKWASTRDFLLVNKFGFPKAVDPNGEGKCKVDEAVVAQSACRTILVINDYPYNFSSDVKHLILWRVHGEAITPLEAKEYAEKYALAHGMSDYTFYINPLHLKSIPDLDHAHILMRLP